MTERKDRKINFFNHGSCVCAHLTQTRHAQKACAEMREQYGNRTGGFIWSVLFGDGLQKAEDCNVGAFSWRGSRMYSVRDSYLAGNGEHLGTICSNSSGGMSGKRCNPDCRKGRERRRGNAAGIRVVAGLESMHFNFVHGLSVDRCCSWLRNGNRCAASEQSAAVCPVSVCCNGDYTAVADLKKEKIMAKKQYQKKREADGYVVVEAAVLLPLASIFIVLLIGLCSYLYQGCFLMQAAYTAAFRSAAQERPNAGYADGQLNQLLEGEVLSFGKEERQIKAGMLRVEVTLERETPLARLAAVGDRGQLEVKQTAYVRNAAAYIRGIRRGKKLGDG